MSKLDATARRAVFEALTEMEGLSLSERVRAAFDDFEKSNTAPEDRRETLRKLLRKAA